MVFGDVPVRDSLTLSNGLRQGYTLQNGTPIPRSKANFEKGSIHTNIIRVVDQRLPINQGQNTPFAISCRVLSHTSESVIK